VIEFGIKLWSINTDAFRRAVSLIEDNVFQYVELTLIPGSDLSLFARSEVPFVVHLPNEGFGVDFGQRMCAPVNAVEMANALAFAEEVDARYIIVHPGSGDLSMVQQMLADVQNSKVLIENMPYIGIDNARMVGYDHKEIKQLMDGRFGFCLDVGHAMKAACSLQSDWKKYVEEFVALQPRMYHCMDGDMYAEKDEHLAIGAGNFDFLSLFSLLPVQTDLMITLETPKKNVSCVNEDVENVQRLKNILREAQGIV